MSTTFTTPPPPSPVSEDGRVRWSGLLRCESLKLTSLRSTRWTLVVVALLIIGAGVAITVASTTGTPADNITSRDAASAFSLPLSGTVLARCLVAAFGVVAVTGDLSSGMTRTTLMAAPHRGRLLLAKAAVVAFWTGVVCAPAVVTAWLLGNARLAEDGLSLAPTNAQVWAALTGHVLALVGLALMGLAAGVLLRSGAAAICTMFGAILVVPVSLELLPEGTVTDSMHRWWVTGTLTNVVDVVHHPDALLGPAGLLAFAAWVVLALTAAGAAFAVRTP